MSVKGFNINGNVEKYDYNSLDNIPDISGGSTNEEWKLLIDVTIPEEDASVTLFVDKDSEGNPFEVEEINIIWQGIKVTDGTQSGKSWITLNPKNAGYNAGKYGYSSASYMYYTSQNNYTSAEGIRLGRGVIWKTGGADTRVGILPFDKITSVEVSGDGRKSFYGRVVIYGR